MATNVSYVKNGIKIKCDTSIYPAPRPKAAYPIPQFPANSTSLLTLSLVSVANQAASGILVQSTGILPGNSNTVWTLYYQSYQGTPSVLPQAVPMPVSLASGLLNITIPNPLNNAVNNFWLVSVDGTTTTTYPYSTINTPVDPTQSTISTINSTLYNTNNLLNTTTTTANNASNQLTAIANSGIITDQERSSLNTWLSTCLQSYNLAVAAATGILSTSYLSLQATSWGTVYSYFYNIIVTLAGAGNYTLPGAGAQTGLQVWQANVTTLSSIPTAIMAALAQAPATGTTLGVVKAGSGVVVDVNGTMTVMSAYNATYTATLGDGSTKLFTVTHGLNTTAIFYNMWETSGPNWVSCDATVTVTGLNTITVNFNNAPAVSAITILVLSPAVITGTGGSSTLPSQTGYGNDFLQTTGAALQWVPISQVPSCTGNANAVLTNNGTTYYWSNSLTNAAGIVATLTAAGLEIPAVCSSLPILPNSSYPLGCIVTLSTNGQLYTNNNNVWSNSVATTQLTGTIGSANLSATAVTSQALTGYTTGSATTISASNTILTALENLQAQIASINTQLVSINATLYSLTHDAGGSGQ